MFIKGVGTLLGALEPPWGKQGGRRFGSDLETAAWKLSSAQEDTLGLAARTQAGRGSLRAAEAEELHHNGES